MTEITENQRKKIIKVEQLEKFAELIDTLYGSTMGASGSNHAPGQVPDPGATAGTSKYLREDGTWVTPPNFSGSYTDLIDKPTIPDAQIQSDWNQTNTSSKDYIKNKPSSMPASDVSAWAKAANKPKYIKSEVGLGNVTNDAQVKRTEMGVASGVATLGSDGKVPASQLPSGVDPTVNKTWAELKAMRDGGTLVPGQWYRITDYTCTTTQENTQSAGHVFDVIVRADGVNVLNENAYAALHSGDTYFSASTLEAWELKYCLDNDTDRFMWADTTNGKGVIFYMKDEFANECPYDFKNIMFERWRASAITTSSTAVTSDMVESLEVIFVDHYHSYQSSNMSICDGKATVVIDSSDSKFFYTFSLCTDDWETFESDDNSTVADGSLKGYGDNMYTSNVIGELIPFDEGYSYKLNNIVFKPIDSSADDCGNNVFGKGCYNITLGFSWTVNNTFGNYCNSNTFGNECGGNTFGNYFQYNTFGNECGGNTFGNYFQYNTFGNNNYNNTFGNNNYNNTFGNECYYNSFGNNCYDNMFGNECYDNTFGKGCQHIVFSKDYCYYNIVENGNQYITLTSTQTTSDSNKLRNITIAQGSNNTTTPKTISHNTVNDTFQTEYKPANSQVISV